MSQSDILSPMQINQALDPQIYQQLSSALINLVYARTQEDVASCSQIFRLYEDYDGYIIYLLEIINNNLPHVSHEDHEKLVSSAFAQLKNIVRKKWLKKENGICNAARQCLINSIIRTSFNISCVQTPNLHYRYMMLLKDIISTAYKQAIFLCPNLVESVGKACNADSALSLLPVYLNIMLGISNVVIIETQTTLYNLYFDLVKQVHPYLFSFAIKGGNMIHQLYNDIAENYNPADSQRVESYKNFVRKYQEILYLSLKFFSKAIRGRFATDFREIALEWMPIAQARIEYIDSTFTLSNSLDIDYSSNSMGYKGDDKFNYFHGKKWGLKFFSRVMTKILIEDKQKLLSDANRIKLNFYAKNFDFFVEFFCNIWSHQWPERIICELFTCLYSFMVRQQERLGKQHPDMLKYFIGTMLPPLLRITQRQVQTLEEYPPNFIDKEDNIKPDANDVRMAATAIWLKATQIEYKFKAIEPKNKGRKDSYGMQLLQNWLSLYNPNTIELRDIGCYLLVKIRSIVSSESWMQQDLADLINQVIAENLLYSQDNYITFAKTLEIFTEYKKIIKAEVLAQIKEIALYLFKNYNPELELKQYHAFVLLKAGQAIQKIIFCDHEIEETDLKMVIQKIFILIKNTCFEEFMNIAIKILIQCFRDLDDYAPEIARFVQSWFNQFVERDRQQMQHYAVTKSKDSFSNLARGTLEIYQTFIYFVKNGNREITEIIEKEIVSIIDYLFADMGTVDEDYNTEVLCLLKSFLSGSRECKRPSNAILNLCKKILIKIPGITKSTMQKLMRKRDSNPTPAQLALINMYMTCDKMVCVDLTDYVGVISNYIQYFKYGETVRPYDKIVAAFLHTETNNTEYLIYLAYTFHRSSYRNNKEADQGKCFSMLMLIYYYEHHLDSKCDVRVHSTVNAFTFRIITQTIRQYSTRPLFAKYNVQLFCLWIHQVKQDCKGYFSSMNEEDLRKFFFNIFIHKTVERDFGLIQFQLDLQVARCVLGISCFISILAKEPVFREFLGFQLIAQIITETIHLTHSGVETDGKSSTGYTQEGQSEEQDQIANYHKLMKAEGISSTYYTERNQYYQQDEQEDEEEMQQCEIACDEAYEILQEDNIDDIPKMANCNEKLMLLNALYEFYEAANVWYWNILEKEQNKDNITDLLAGCGAMKVQENKYLTKLVGSRGQDEGQGRLSY